MKTCPHCGGDLWDDSTTTHAAHKDITNEWFDAFWQAYWRKRDKGHALKAFKRECESEETFLAIMKAIEVQGPEMRSRAKDKVPYPATWLNGRCWLDEPETPQAKQARILTGHELFMARKQIEAREYEERQAMFRKQREEYAAKDERVQ